MPPETPSPRSATTSGRVTAAPGPVAVAVRLRGLWLGEVVSSRAFLRSDLGDAADEIALHRVGNALELVTPYDFGDGDPLEGGLGRSLRRRVSAVTGGVVREVSWRYDDAAGRPVRRTSTSDLDVFRPGDPGRDAYPDVLAELRRRLPADTTDAAREVLGALGLAAVSAHRVWFAAPSAAAEKAVGSTPGAAYALFASVKRLQRKEPLYRVYADADGVEEDLRLAPR